MKKVFSIMLLCMVTIALIGCGVTPLSQNQVDLQQSKYTAQGQCYERLKAQDLQLNTLLSKVPESQVALVIVLQSMQENNKALMAIATGNDYNPCADGASAFDVQIAEVVHKNKAASEGLTGFFGLGKWIVGGLTVTAIADKIGDETITASGGSEINQESKNTTSVATGTTATSTPTSSNDAPNSNTSSPVEEEEPIWTEDDPNCSVASREAGRC